ncbi:hypothetical protein [Bradyrhizobium sp. USDA 10063]
MSTADRRGMLDRNDAKLSIRARCAMLVLSRSGVYRQRAANDDNDPALMRRIDELFLQHSFLARVCSRKELCLTCHRERWRATQNKTANSYVIENFDVIRGNPRSRPHLSGESAPRICQSPRLDQQTLSFVAATGPAEAHDNCMSRALRFRAPREQGIARR